MEELRLSNERDHNLRVVFKYNKIEVDDKKLILHAKSWDI